MEVGLEKGREELGLGLDLELGRVASRLELGLGLELGL